MQQAKTIFSRYFFPFMVLSLFLFLYLPIVVLIAFSFNDNAYTYQWSGFTLQWYHELFESVEIWDALKNSLIVAASSVFLSTIMGVLLV
ncbi:MAG: hypothetical protein P4L31_05275, partial [Candidatus Babeliales bacterium]|nr:hypothetical protein [Candidatus Babeliales bacterium]